MERIKNLDKYQKGILLLLAAMVLVFGAAYSVVSSRIGFSYRDAILSPEEVNGNTVYSGRIRGQSCCFTVTADKTVMFQWGDKSYGPYIARRDPSAIPRNSNLRSHMTGVEVKCGEEILFRGGIVKNGGEDSFWILENEDGTAAGITVTAAMSNGTEIGEDGTAVDPVEPSVSEILRLMDDPELTHKGQWILWFLGVCASAVAAATVLFADELFMLKLALRVRYPESAEPSDWEMIGRYIRWTALTAITIVIYIIGLLYAG